MRNRHGNKQSYLLQVSKIKSYLTALLKISTTVARATDEGEGKLITYSISGSPLESIACGAKEENRFT